MSIEAGDRVRTPSGDEGTVAQEKVHDVLHLVIWEGHTKRAVQAHPVLLDSGEVRFFTASALTELESDTP